MHNMTPYLHFNGTAESAMQFYKSVLGGEITIAQRYREMPGGEKMDSADRDKFMHISLQLSDKMTIMATDLLEVMGPLVVGTNYHICLHTESEAETERLVKKLSEKGKVTMPVNKTFWGASFGMCTDSFGIQWMISYTPTTSQHANSN